jgi:tRNA threonylcarbamoyl adenosine modification protein YjeE
MSATEQTPQKPYSVAQMQAFAGRVARQLRHGDCIALSGDLGTGKTAFSRALIQAIAPGAPEVTSPTFMLMQSYPVVLADGTDETLWHLDLYRIEESAEVEALGLDELWPHITLVEWPERIAPLLPQQALYITFAYTQDEQSRLLQCTANDAWRERLRAIW